MTIPAGLFKMPFGRFSLMTILGAGLFNGALAWFGMRVLGDQPGLMQDPEALRHALASKSMWLVGFGVAVAALAAFGTSFAQFSVDGQLLRAPLTEVHLPASVAPYISAVTGLSYSVEKGKTLGIVGESGSGKSVSSMAVLGLGGFTLLARRRQRS